MRLFGRYLLEILTAMAKVRLLQESVVLLAVISRHLKDGSSVTGFPVNVGKYPMSPTLSDLDDNGTMEIILGTRTGQAYVYKGDGTVYPGWPKAMDRYVGASASAGDVNADGVMDVVMESRNLLYVWNKDGQILPGFPFAILDSLVGSNSYSAPVLVDLTGDGKLEIVFCSHSDVTNAGGIIYAVKMMEQIFPVFLKLFQTGFTAHLSLQILMEILNLK